MGKTTKNELLFLAELLIEKTWGKYILSVRCHTIWQKGLFIGFARADCADRKASIDCVWSKKICSTILLKKKWQNVRCSE